MRTLGLLLVLLAASLAALSATPAGPALAHPEDFADVDHDGIREPPYGPDNCPGSDGTSFNPEQTDTDADGRGDVCDDDDDGDAVGDGADTCVLIADPAQTDTDADGRGDVCDDDDDGDGVLDARDNCRVVANADQRDRDGDDPGDACPGGASAGARPGDDVTPPRIGVRVAGRHRVAEVAAGIPVAVSCSEACALSSAIERAPRRTALGSGTAQLGAAGRTFVFVRLSAAARRRMRRGPLRTVVRLIAADVTGNRVVVERRVTVTR
jgi:hypothetical protein